MTEILYRSRQENGEMLHVIVKPGDLVEIRNPNPYQQPYARIIQVEGHKVKIAAKRKDGSQMITYRNIENLKPHPDTPGVTSQSVFL